MACCQEHTQSTNKLHFDLDISQTNLETMDYVHLVNSQTNNQTDSKHLLEDVKVDEQDFRECEVFSCSA